MQVMKTTAAWGPLPETETITHPDGRKFRLLEHGEGRNTASFTIEIVGHDADEVEHLKSLASESAVTSVTFEGGALKITSVFERSVTIEQQAELKAEADKRDAKRRDAEKLEAAAQKRADDLLVEKRAQEIAAAQPSAVQTSNVDPDKTDDKKLN
jgi:hypothetical protein